MALTMQKTSLKAAAGRPRTVKVQATKYAEELVKTAVSGRSRPDRQCQGPRASAGRWSGALPQISPAGAVTRSDPA